MRTSCFAPGTVQMVQIKFETYLKRDSSDARSYIPESMAQCTQSPPISKLVGGLTRLRVSSCGAECAFGGLRSAEADVELTPWSDASCPKCSIQLRGLWISNWKIWSLSRGFGENTSRVEQSLGPTSVERSSVDCLHGSQNARWQMDH
jgi:hypothetical protein